MGEIVCPFCGEDRLIEWCDVLQHYVCVVCARTWLENMRAPMYGAPPAARARRGTSTGRSGAPNSVESSFGLPSGTEPQASTGPELGAVRHRLRLVIVALEVLARRDDDDDRLAEAALEAAVESLAVLDRMIGPGGPTGVEGDDVSYLRRSGTRRSVGPS